MSTILFGKAFENIIFKVIQVIVKQYQHFMNYADHNKSKI